MADRLVAEIQYDIELPEGPYLMFDPGFNFLIADWVKLFVTKVDPIEIEVVEYG